MGDEGQGEREAWETAEVWLRERDALRAQLAEQVEAKTRLAESVTDLQERLDAEQEAHRSAEWHLSEANNAYDAVKSVNDDFAREVLKLRADLDAERASYDRMFKDASKMEADLTRERARAERLRGALEASAVCRHASDLMYAYRFDQETRHSGVFNDCEEPNCKSARQALRDARGRE